MLGNLHHADDATQETLLRAWRGLPGYEPRARLSTWLHRIATNVALRMLERRRPTESLDAHLQPYPDRLTDDLPTPEAQAIARERLGLAYIAAMQLLPARGARAARGPGLVGARDRRGARAHHARRQQRPAARPRTPGERIRGARAHP
jgi:DNA-directed RNA polymerase specialized sigma24 family protein